MAVPDTTAGDREGVDSFFFIFTPTTSPFVLAECLGGSIRSSSLLAPVMAWAQGTGRHEKFVIIGLKQTRFAILKSFVDDKWVHFVYEMWVQCQSSRQLSKASLQYET
jgi:hypothetical protein